MGPEYLKPRFLGYQGMPTPTQWTERQRVGLPGTPRKRESGTPLEVSEPFAVGKVSTRHPPGK